MWAGCKFEGSYSFTVELSLVSKQGQAAGRTAPQRGACKTPGSCRLPPAGAEDSGTEHHWPGLLLPGLGSAHQEMKYCIVHFRKCAADRAEEGYYFDYGISLPQHFSEGKSPCWSEIPGQTTLSFISSYHSVMFFCIFIFKLLIVLVPDIGSLYAILKKKTNTQTQKKTLADFSIYSFLFEI